MQYTEDFNTPEDISRVLNRESGLMGVSGQSSDMRDVIAAMEAGDHDATLAYEMYVDRIQKHIGQYLAVLNGADAIIFTAGIGENAANVREDVISGISWFGCDVDPEKNVFGVTGDISTDAAKIRVLVIPTDEELEILWNNLYKDKRKIVDIVLILCYTGLRIGELLNIKVKDIDLKEKTINITNSKTVNGLRTIPIHDKLLPLISNRMYKGNEYLFTTLDNKHYKYDSFDNHFRILCKDLKLKYHTLHDTRHTFATLLVNAEVNKEVIIKMIGHKRYKTTLDIYVHKNYDDMKRAINQI